MSASDRSYWINLSEFYSPMRRLFTEPPNEEREAGGVTECDYCLKIAPARMFIPNPQYRPICLCCVVRYAYLAAVGEDDDVPLRPAYARQLLDESDFGRRRVVPMEDVDEIELEDPENGRVFGSVDIHRATGREIVWDDDGNARVCLTCPSGGGACWLCCPPPPRSERIFSLEDAALLAQFM
jgi:hypothetical protein